MLFAVIDDTYVRAFAKQQEGGGALGGGRGRERLLNGGETRVKIDRSAVKIACV